MPEGLAMGKYTRLLDMISQLSVACESSPDGGSGYPDDVTRSVRPRGSGSCPRKRHGTQIAPQPGKAVRIILAAAN
jgi:hypothetical protein